MMNFCSILFGYTYQKVYLWGGITNKRSSDFVAQDDLFFPCREDHEYHCKVVFSDEC